MPIDIFLSVGKTSTGAQEDFVRSVEDLLRANGLNPHTLGRSDWSSEAPLRSIQRLMLGCTGTVIIAFERGFAPELIDRRGSSDEQVLKEQRLPTVWNQIEATMAWSRGHPLLVLVERGLREEGILEASHDWYVQRLDLSDSSLRSNEFAGIFADWRRRVEQRAEGGAAEDRGTGEGRDPEQMSLKEIFGSLKPAQAWRAGGAIASAATALFGMGLYVGHLWK